MGCWEALRKHPVALPEAAAALPRVRPSGRPATLLTSSCPHQPGSLRATSGADPSPAGESPSHSTGSLLVAPLGGRRSGLLLPKSLHEF